MTALAEAYFHFRPFGLNATRMEELGNRISVEAASIAQASFDLKIEVAVELEQGSLKGWARAQAVGVSLFLFVGTYGDLKSGLRELIIDGRAFTTYVLDKIEQLTEVPKESIFRTERRTETPGRIDRALRRLEQLQANVHDLSPNQLEEEMKEVTILLRRAVEDLSQEDKRRIGEIAAEEYRRLPARLDLITLPSLPKHPPIPASTNVIAALPPEIERAERRSTVVPDRELKFRPPEPARYRYKNKFAASEIVPKGQLLVEPQQPLWESVPPEVDDDEAPRP